MATLIPREPDTSPQQRHVYHIIVTIQLILCMAGTGWSIGRAVTSGQLWKGPTAAVQAHPHPGKPIGTRTKSVQGCERGDAWEYTYPTPYLGEVYVDLTANPHTLSRAVVTLTWGPWRWEHEISIWPGMVQFGQGGTMLWYSKLYTTGRTGINPPIYLESSVPVCAYFGTTWDGMPTPVRAINANPGWYHWES
jgi:hypothetical protein